MSSYYGGSGRRRGNYNNRRYNNSGYSGRWYSRRGGSSTSSRAFGQMRAAKQQNDQSVFTLNIPSQISCFAATEGAPSNGTANAVLAPGAIRGVYAMNIFDILRKSQFFQNYAAMYDEFKIDKIKVKLLPSQWQVNALDNENKNYSNLTVYTAWDRSGLSKDQIEFFVGTDYEKNTDTSQYTIGTANGTTVGNGESAYQDYGGVYCSIGEDITTYSSAESRVINPNTNTQIVRWLSPKTIQEKSQWISTGLLTTWYEGYDTNTGRFYGIKTGPLNNVDEILSSAEGIVTLTSGGSGTAAAQQLLKQYISPANGDNPCYLLEDQGIKFKPTLLVGIFPAQSAKTGNWVNSEEPPNKIGFNVETEVVCSFRGLRKAKIISQ